MNKEQARDAYEWRKRRDHKERMEDKGMGGAPKKPLVSPDHPAAAEIMNLVRDMRELFDRKKK